MPGALTAIKAEDAAREADGLLLPNAELIKLWLPSDLPPLDRPTGCMGPLPAMEKKLREAQCNESLEAVRNRLHAQKHLIYWRNKNVRGQNHSTRSRTLIGAVGDRIKSHQLKYTRARDALWALGGAVEFEGRFKALLNEHLVLDAEGTQHDHEAHRKMRAAGGGGPRAPKKVVEGSESRKTLSWIWVAGIIPGEDEDLSIHSCESRSCFWLFRVVC